jgi:hypothetical protein
MSPLPDVTEIPLEPTKERPMDARSTSAAGPAGAPGRSESPPRFEVPTHLDVEDRPFCGLTVRQVLVLALGGAWAYGLWAQEAGPAALRLALAAGCVLLVAAGVLGWGAWGLAALRYALTPRVAVWRPAPPPEAGGRPPIPGADGAAADGADTGPEDRPAGSGWVPWAPGLAWAAAGPPGAAAPGLVVAVPGRASIEVLRARAQRTRVGRERRPWAG